MDKKRIGAFIAKLRKEKGMTQKELGDLLNVSDKTISRYECGILAPDLELIERLSAIFSISCDELIRGDRNTVIEKEACCSNYKSAYQKYTNYSFISISLSFVGLIISLVCNFSFYKANLGGWLSILFFAFSIIIQIVLTNKTLFSYDNSNSCEEIASYKNKTIKKSERIISGTFLLICFIIPLIFLEANRGFTIRSFLLYGLFSSLLGFLISIIILFFLNKEMVDKSILILNETEKEKYYANYYLKKKTSFCFSIILIFLILIHFLVFSVSYNHFYSSNSIVFNDLESFTKYMEEDIPYEDNYSSNNASPAKEIKLSEIEYYDEYGNKIDRDEALKREIKDSKGNVVCSYIKRNENVISFRYTERNGEILPITAITQDGYREAERSTLLVSYIYSLIYPTLLIVALTFYFIKRKK